jgi:hypothetical protein
MDDNRINQLMDEGWKKLNLTLESELPVKKDRKFVYIWLVLAGCVLAGLSYYQLYPTAENLNIEIDRNPKSQSEIIANQRGLNDVDSFKSDNNEIKNKDKTIYANNSAINTNLNENTTYDNPSVDRAEIKRLWTEIQTPKSFDHIKPKSKESAPQTNHLDQQSETFSLQKLSSDINRKENVEDLKYENSLINKEDVKNDAIKKEGIYAISNLPVDAMVPLSSNYVNKIQIAPFKIQKNNEIHYGLKTSAAFTGVKAPGSFKIGGYAQKIINRRWNTELSLQYQKYFQYQVIHHNGQSINNILYQNAQVTASSPSGRAVSSAFISNSKTLTINQLDFVDETILSNSVNSLHLINAEINAGYKFLSKWNLIGGLGISRRIRTAYELNETNMALYSNLGNDLLQKSQLTSGNQLIRKWIYSGSVGVEYNASEKMSIRYSVVYTPVLFNSQLFSTTSKDQDNSSLSFEVLKITSDKNAINLLIPDQGKVSFELGILYKLK